MSISSIIYLRNNQTPTETVDTLIECLPEHLAQQLKFVERDDDTIVIDTPDFRIFCWALNNPIDVSDIEALNFLEHFGFKPNLEILFRNALEIDLMPIIVKIIRRTEWDFVFEAADSLRLFRFEDQLNLDQDSPYNDLFEELYIPYSIAQLGSL